MFRSKSAGGRNMTESEYRPRIIDKKVDEYLSKLLIGTLVDLDTYSVNTAKKLYFDRSQYW